MRAIAWRGGPLLEERPLPSIPPGYVLVRTDYAAWTGVEDAAAAGVTLPGYGVVLGHTGSGRVVEAGIGAERLSGAYVAPTRIPGSTLPGIDVDGYLAEYTAQPVESLEEIDPELGWLTALALPAALACDTLEKIEEWSVDTVAVLGGGVYAVLTATVLLKHGIEVRMDAKPRCGAETGGRGDAETAVVARHPVHGLRCRRCILHPVAARLSHPAPPAPGESRTIYVPRGSKHCVKTLLRDARSCLEKILATVEELAVPPGGEELVFILRGRRAPP